MASLFPYFNIAREYNVPYRDVMMEVAVFNGDIPYNHPLVNNKILWICGDAIRAAMHQENLRRKEVSNGSS